MPKIKFTATPVLPRDIAHLNYKKDDVVTLSEDSCNRWIRRGVAEFVKEEVKVAPPVVFEEAPEWVQPEDFDPEKSDLDDVRAYLTKNDIDFHPNTGETKLRSKAADHFAAA